MKFFPGLGDAFGLFAKILGADGQVHFQTQGLEGEALLPEYQLQATFSNIPDVIRPVLQPIVKLLLGDRMSRMTGKYFKRKESECNRVYGKHL